MKHAIRLMGRKPEDSEAGNSSCSSELSTQGLVSTMCPRSCSVAFLRALDFQLQLGALNTGSRLTLD